MLELVGHKKFDRFQTVRNKCQQVPTLLWFHANGRNKSQHCCCWPTMLRPFAWALRLVKGVCVCVCVCVCPGGWGGTDEVFLPQSVEF